MGSTESDISTSDVTFLGRLLDSLNTFQRITSYIPMIDGRIDLEGVTLGGRAEEWP